MNPKYVALAIELEQDLAALLDEVSKFNEKQSKAAARRIRTGTIALGKLAKDFRAASMEM